MQVIIPTAGKGTRLKPHTHTLAKPLFHIAGKPVLGHILDELKKLNVSEVIFIVGYLGNQIENYVKKNYKFKTRFITQKELKGQAHAVKLAEPYVKEDVIIWFVDTISDQNLKKIKTTKADGIIYVKEHEDPERFGIVFPDKNGIVKKIIEKPKNPPSNLANIGLYYTKDYKLMFECIDELIKKDMHLKGEFYLMDAFNIMIKKGTRFIAEKVNVWEDCGKPETVLSTNRYLLKKTKQKMWKELKNSMVIPPVMIEEGTQIENSIIGPYVSIAKGAKIKNSIIKDSVLGTQCFIEDIQLNESLVAAKAKAKGTFKKLNVGEDSEIIFENGHNT